MNRHADVNPREPLTALGVNDVIGVRTVAGGMDTLIWHVTTTTGTYALRLFRPDQQEQWAKEVEVNGARWLAWRTGAPHHCTRPLGRPAGHAHGVVRRASHPRRGTRPP